MRGMILAAGMGTRLLPLTESIPKALIEAGGRPLLKLALAKMNHPCDGSIVVNAHYLAEQVEQYLAERPTGDQEPTLIIEKEILGTGGGVRNAADLLGDQEEVLVHNVDVLSTISLDALREYREKSGAVAVIAVQNRSTSRPLAIDSSGELCGRFGDQLVREPVGEVTPAGFSGIQLLAPGVAGRLPGTGSFSIVESYLEMVRVGESVVAYFVDDAYWIDLGTPERMRRLEEDLSNGTVTITDLTS